MLTFDESAEDAARTHAADESAAGYTCHYVTKNTGPSSRYLASGGMGLTGEALALVGGADATSAFRVAEGAFIAEKLLVPAGGHALNVLDPSHLWAGVAAVTVLSAPAFYNVDYELVTPSAQSVFVGASGYPIAATCPTGVTVNQS